MRGKRARLESRASLVWSSWQRVKRLSSGSSKGGSETPQEVWNKWRYGVAHGDPTVGLTRAIVGLYFSGRFRERVTAGSR